MAVREERGKWENWGEEEREREMELIPLEKEQYYF